MTLKTKIMMNWIRFYPPLFFAGIRVYKEKGSIPSYRTTLKATWYNPGIRGTHFGGSLSAMTDPFYMLVLMEALGDQYLIWDKETTIRFLKATGNPVEAHFQISSEEIDALRMQADRGETILPKFTVSVHETSGRKIAEVEKTLYVRRIGL